VDARSDDDHGSIAFAELNVHIRPMFGTRLRPPIHNASRYAACRRREIRSRRHPILTTRPPSVILYNWQVLQLTDIDLQALDRELKKGAAELLLLFVLEARPGTAMNWVN
jgi:hypothetical protein